MSASLVVLLSLIGVVHQLEITASYTTPYQCSDGSYALISGTNLTLEYDYKHHYSKLQSFHLYEMSNVRHMFDYEKTAGQAFMKDRNNRLKSYEWTNTGIKLMIPDINKNMDLGNYQGEVETDQDYNKIAIEVKQIFDPPAEVILTSPSHSKNVNLTKGSGEYVFEVSAESYKAIACNSAMLIWVSSTGGTLLSCQAQDAGNPTVCPLTLKESEMTAGECMTLEVYAEQYGVRSEKKTYNVCYYDISVSRVSSLQIITAMMIGVFVLLLTLVAILIVYHYHKRKAGPIQELEHLNDPEAGQADERLYPQ